MNSTTVNKRIRSEIRPALKAAGFIQFTGRSAWRYASERVDVINFQSFNSYNASVIGCTTYSFAVNLGSYFTDIPGQYGDDQIKQKDGRPVPEEYQCPFRGRLRRSFAQAELDDRDIWYVDPAGSHLDKALHDVRMAIVRDALPWFARLDGPSEVLRILLAEDERMGELWGFGNRPSPIRHYLTGYVARKLGSYELARRHLSAALDSGCFTSVADRIRRDLEACA